MTRTIRSIMGGALAATLLASASARADELTTQFSGKIQEDLRFRVENKGIGSYYERLFLPAGIERAQTLLSGKFKASYGRFSGVAAIDLYFNPYTGQLNDLGELTQYANKTQMFSFEPQSLYVEGKDLGLKGLDLRVGQQLILWGVGDQFNPTNNLNSDDLRDPLQFGKQVPNFMVKLDYWVTKNFSMTGVLVPIFRPALLPASAVLGGAAIQRLPFTSEKLRHRIEAENAYALSAKYPAVIEKVTPELPKAKAENMQFAFRLAGTLAEQDLQLSYYNGRTDFPQPISNDVNEVADPKCSLAGPRAKCVDGRLGTNVKLAYPRMHVYGFNAAGQINVLQKISSKLEALGYRFEAAVIVPERTTMEITTGQLQTLLQPAGEYDYDGDNKRGGPRPAVVDATPFMKWTLGLDYNFSANWYLNVQWVHGLADEFGAGDWMHKGWSVRQSGVGNMSSQTLLTRCVTPRDGKTCAVEVLRPKIGDYLATVIDFKFLNDAALLRLFTMFDLAGYHRTSWSESKQKRITRYFSLFTPEGFSAVIYPEFNYNFGNGLELGCGALLELGKAYTKFGDPAAGGSLVWTRGRYSF
jgi:hypothetical protein